jgi:acetyl-CoA C-acetyltransferase
MEDAVIVSAVRTAIGESGKTLAPVPAKDLGVIVAKEAVARARIDPVVFDDVIAGEAMGGGHNSGRWIGLKAGVPREVPGTMVVRACATGLEAVIQAATGVWAGVGEAYMCVGTESMSQGPYLQRKPLEPWQRRPPEYFVPESHPSEMAPQSVFIVVGENVAERFGITREDQDRWSLTSHQRAIAAIDNGYFKKEIVPVPVPRRKQEPLIFDVDERPRRDTSMEQLAKLPVLSREGGTVTAGNSSGTNDAASALVVTSASKAQTLGLKPRAFIRGWANVGVDPNYTGTGPIEAVPKALKRAGITLDDVDLVEINEAFAAMTVASIRELGLDPERTNVNGGAVALGHPIGCTGARLLTTLLHELERREKRYGVATMCAGGGLGAAMVIERVS